MIRWALPLLALGACIAPRDPFRAAEWSLLRQDLPRALVAFDAVPVSHVRYPEARATALTVERRMRRGHELLLEALMLRAEWRDQEALAVLYRAQIIWPRMPGIESLIEATRKRTTLLGAEREAAARVAALVTAPVEDEAVESPGEPTEPTVDPEPTLEPPTDAPPAFAEEPVSEDPVALGLVAVEARLAHGDLEAAVTDLIELADRFPADMRVSVRLARVLHQRALLRYGHGHLAAAIVDWERVTQLDADNALARELLRAARAEAGAPRPTPLR